MQLDKENVVITKLKIDHDDLIRNHANRNGQAMQTGQPEIDNIKWGISQRKEYLLNTLFFLRLQRKKSYAGDLRTNLFFSFLGGNMCQ